MVEALPMCWWLPPPWGCSTGFIATPLTLGHFFLWQWYLWNLLPAFKTGLSVLPPAATKPTIALASPLKVFLAPEGNLTLVLLESSEWPMMIELHPEALAKVPWSPGFCSTLQTVVPSGILPIGRTLPVARVAKKSSKKNQIVRHDIQFFSFSLTNVKNKVDWNIRD